MPPSPKCPADETSKVDEGLEEMNRDVSIGRGDVKQESDADDDWIMDLETTIIKFRARDGDRRPGEMARGLREARYRPVSMHVLMLTMVCVIWDLLCFGVMIHSFKDVQNSKSGGTHKLLVWLLACILPMTIVGVILAMTVSHEWRKSRQPVVFSPQPEPQQSQTNSSGSRIHDSRQALV